VGDLGRGVSNVVAEALLLVVGVSLAAALLSAVVSRVSIVQSRFSNVVSELAQSVVERLAYVYATYSPSEGAFVVYLKNVGSYPIYQLNASTVLFGGAEGLQYLPYCSSQRVGCWRVVELGVVNNTLDPAETVAVYVYNSTSVTPPYRFKLVTARGTAVEATFTVYW
jgi:archaellum component FlaG (FlaF/FlaG flagellin family)